MANEMPSSSDFTGLTRAVIACSEAFTHVIDKARARAPTDSDWQAFVQLVEGKLRHLDVYIMPRGERPEAPAS